MNINMILNQYWFQWDDEKDVSNQQKHGISFHQAASVWKDEESIEGPATDIETEIRWVRVGIASAEDASKLVAVIFSYRGKSIRIISARTARNYEKEIYEQGKE